MLFFYNWEVIKKDVKINRQVRGKMKYEVARKEPAL